MLRKLIGDLVASKLDSKDFGTTFEWIDEGLVLRKDVPEWLTKYNNQVYSYPNSPLPEIVQHPNIEPACNALLIFGTHAQALTITLWGNGPTVVLSPAAHLFGRIGCGDDSLVLVGKDLYSGPGAHLNARNGGSIVVGDDNLWSDGIILYTDDMHAIRDAKTGNRLNSFGGRVIIGKHVWLGLDVLLLPGAVVSDHCVIGARSVVKGSLPPNSVGAGIPARLVQSGITWTRADEP